MVGMVGFGSPNGKHTNGSGTSKHHCGSRLRAVRPGRRAVVVRSSCALNGVRFYDYCLCLWPGVHEAPGMLSWPNQYARTTVCVYGQVCMGLSWPNHCAGSAARVCTWAPWIPFRPCFPAVPHGGSRCSHLYAVFGNSKRRGRAVAMPGARRVENFWTCVGRLRAADQPTVGGRVEVVEDLQWSRQPAFSRSSMRSGITTTRW